MDREKDLLSSLNKAIDLLDVFENGEPFMSLDSLSAATGFPKPTVFRIAQTFISRGLMVQDSRTKKYGLGFGLMKYSRIITSNTNLIAMCEPLMRQVRDQINESVILSVRDNAGYSICVHVMKNNQFIQFGHHVGQRKPLYAGSVGRCILAFSSQKFVQDYLNRTELIKLASNTITNPDTLMDEIKKVREAGFCISQNEVNENTKSISIPLLDKEGEFVACINIASLPNEDDATYEQRAVALLKEAAEKFREL